MAPEGSRLAFRGDEGVLSLENGDGFAPLNTVYSE